MHSAVALRRDGSSWSAQDVDLDDVETLDDLIDELDDLDSDATEDDLTIVFIEEEKRNVTISLKNGKVVEEENK